MWYESIWNNHSEINRFTWSFERYFNDAIVTLIYRRKRDRRLILCVINKEFSLNHYLIISCITFRNCSSYWPLRCRVFVLVSSIAPRNKIILINNTSHKVCTRIALFVLVLCCWGPFYWYWLTSISIWISNYGHYKVCDEIIHPFSNLNGAAIKVSEWICNVSPHYWACDYLFMLGLDS